MFQLKPGTLKKSGIKESTTWPLKQEIICDDVKIKTKKIGRLIKKSVKDIKKHNPEFSFLKG